MKLANATKISQLPAVCTKVGAAKADVARPQMKISSLESTLQNHRCGSTDPFCAGVGAGSEAGGVEVAGVVLTGAGESVVVDALCELVVSDAAFGATGTVVIALSGFSR